MSLAAAGGLDGEVFGSMYAAMMEAGRSMEDEEAKSELSERELSDIERTSPGGDVLELAAQKPGALPAACEREHLAAPPLDDALGREHLAAPAIDDALPGSEVACAAGQNGSVNALLKESATGFATSTADLQGASAGGGAEEPATADLKGLATITADLQGASAGGDAKELATTTTGLQVASAGSRPSHALRRLARSEFEREFVSNFKGSRHLLGSGSEGQVVAVMSKTTGQLYAVKWCSKVFSREIDILNRISRTRPRPHSVVGR